MKHIKPISKAVTSSSTIGQVLTTIAAIIAAIVPLIDQIENNKKSS